MAHPLPDLKLGVSPSPFPLWVSAVLEAERLCFQHNSAVQQMEQMAERARPACSAGANEMQGEANHRDPVLFASSQLLAVSCVPQTMQHSVHYR